MQQEGAEEQKSPGKFQAGKEGIKLALLSPQERKLKQDQAKKVGWGWDKSVLRGKEKIEAAARNEVESAKAPVMGG